MIDTDKIIQGILISLSFSKAAYFKVHDWIAMRSCLKRLPVVLNPMFMNKHSTGIVHSSKPYEGIEKIGSDV